MKAILIGLIALIIPLSSAYSQDEISDINLKSAYREILNSFYEMGCSRGCIRDTLRSGVIFCDCIRDVTVGHRVDDANRELDSLEHFGMQISSLIIRITAKEEKVRRELSELEEMKTAADNAMQSLLVKIGYLSGKQNNKNKTGNKQIEQK